MNNFDNTLGVKESSSEKREIPTLKTKRSKHSHPQKLRRNHSRLKFHLLRLVTLSMIICMLVTSNPAAPKTVIAGSGELYHDARFALASYGFTSGFLGFFNNQSSRKRSKKRKTQISKISILPDGKIVVYQDQTIDFSAIGYSAKGETVGGIKYRWSVIDAGRKNAKPRRIPSGRFKAEAPGDYVITAEAMGNKATASIEVKSNPAVSTLKRLKLDEVRGEFTEINKLEKENKYRSTEISSKKKYQKSAKSGGKGFGLSTLFDWLTQDEEKPNGPNEGSSEKTEESGSSFVRPDDEDGWDDDNWWRADDPDQQIGNPTGTSPDTGAGNGNFRITAPIVSLPGRGIDVNLALNYNSKLWNKDDTEMIFDADRGYPAPGWSLGFGKMIFVGPNGGCLLADADGTRRGYTGTATTYINGDYTSTTFDGHTADGSFIDYDCTYASGPAGTSTTGTVRLPNGTSVVYGGYSENGDQAYPTSISDANGNYIVITYRWLRAPEIQTITDTLGRVITFNYDSANRLVSVSVPKLNGGTRTAVRLHYKPLNLNPGFAGGLTTNTVTNTPEVLDSIYYPGTGTGFWFDDPDSYSSYGMIAKVKEMRGMTSTGTDTDQGIVTPGTASNEKTYDYPLAPDNSLTDSPTYSTLTETWDGIDTIPAITTYQVNFNSTPRTIEVTRPNGLKSKQYMYNESGDWKDGLIYKDENYNPKGLLLNKSEVTWEEGAYDSGRPIENETTDEKGQKLKLEMSYGQNYNQVTSVKEYEYDGVTLSKETKNTYENSPSYTDRHIFSLLKSTEVLDENGVRVSKANYEYDNNAVVNGTTNHDLSPATDVVMHFASADPYTTEMRSGDTCLIWEYPQGCNLRSCRVCVEYNQVSAYVPETIFRGNVTKVTQYTDAQNLSGAISETRKYDIVGNAVTTLSPGDIAKTFTFDLSTQFAYPINQSIGSSNPSSPTRNTTSVLYDFNTGLPTRTTDANGRNSTIAYDPKTLRSTISASASGGYTQFTYDDLGMSTTEELRDANGTLASRTTKYLNGIGKVNREESLGTGGSVDIIETQYNNLGDVWKKTNPYRSGQTPQWAESQYDIQGRAGRIIEPDGSVSEAFYDEVKRPSSASTKSGKTVRVVDTWGRSRWELYDRRNKLVEVVEPDPNGNGDVFEPGNTSTKYTFDVLSRLTKTEQGNQTRSIEYDSLSRVIRQKLAEQTATLNEAGVYVGSGNSNAKWSEAFWYDARSNVYLKTDARGVKTNYIYQNNGVDDPLNRLQAIGYDLSGPRDNSITIHNAASISYEYMTSGDQTRIKKTLTAGFLTEDFSYDSEGRVSEFKQTVDYRTSYPMTTSYIYDTLDRIKETRYPAQYGLAGNPRKVVEQTYDVASRITSLKVDGQDQASGITYNAADQAVSVKVGSAGANQITETYSYDSQTGFTTNQKVKRGSQTLLDLSYDYSRGNSNGSINGRTGQIGQIVNNLDSNKNRRFEYDALGRLKTTVGGSNLWLQNYTYDRYGNRTNVTASGVAADNSAIPRDGVPNLTYSSDTNRITTSGYEYDVAGNQTRSLAEDGVSWIKYEYDAANRLQIVKKDDGTLLQAFQFGSSNARLMSHDYVSNQLTIFANNGGEILSEYKEFTPQQPTWTKSNIYLGQKLLSTSKRDSAGGETTEFSHSDQLGTRIITNEASGTSAEQVSLPFGTALNAESTGSISKRFTSYERSERTGLDYAVNRTYDSKLGRFTQVDPIGFSAVNFHNPQSLNLYNYVGNDPVNRTDPDGLFWGFFKKLFKAIGKLFKYIAVIAAVVAAVITIIFLPVSAPLFFKILTVIGAVANAASSLLNFFGLKLAGTIFGIIGAATSFGLTFYQNVKGTISLIKKWTTKALLTTIRAGAALASRVLGAFGHSTASSIVGIGADIVGFIGKGYNGKSPDIYSLKRHVAWKRSALQWFAFVRGTAQKIATLIGAKKLAAYLNLAGLVEDGFAFYGLLTKKLPKPRISFPGSIPFPNFPGVKFYTKIWKIGMVIVRAQDGYKIVNRSIGRVNAVRAAG